MGVTPNGQDKTAPDKPITHVIVDIYYVVIMIDASHPEKAFIKTLDGSTAHNPVAEPGHALHYIVKNGIIQSVLSFGPSSAAAAAMGPATADCTMKNMVYAFRYNLTKDTAEKLIKETDKWRASIASYLILYSGITNDTCAETMLEILRAYISDLPKGKGKTGTYHVYLKAVTPYWLFDDYKKIGTPYKVYPSNPNKYTKEDAKALKIFYVPIANEKDSIEW